MAFRLATLQRQILAGDAAVSGGVVGRPAPVSGSEDAEFAQRVQEMKTWMGTLIRFVSGWGFEFDVLNLNGSPKTGLKCLKISKSPEIAVSRWLECQIFRSLKAQIQQPVQAVNASSIPPAPTRLKMW